MAGHKKKKLKGSRARRRGDDLSPLEAAAKAQKLGKSNALAILKLIAKLIKKNDIPNKFLDTVARANSQAVKTFTEETPGSEGDDNHVEVEITDAVKPEKEDENKTPAIAETEGVSEKRVA